MINSADLYNILTFTATSLETYHEYTKFKKILKFDKYEVMAYRNENGDEIFVYGNKIIGRNEADAKEYIKDYESRAITRGICFGIRIGISLLVITRIYRNYYVQK